MPRRARGGAAVVRGKKLVNYTWSGLQVKPTSIAPGIKMLLGFFFLQTGFEETVVRIRGLLSVTSDQAGVSESQYGALGFIRVTDVARGIGASAIPGPLTDSDDDGWLLWQGVAQRGSQSFGTTEPYILDSKAQRIVREGQELAVMYETGDATFTEGQIISLNLRALARFRS